MAIMQTATLLS